MRGPRISPWSTLSQGEAQVVLAFVPIGDEGAGALEDRDAGTSVPDVEIAGLKQPALDGEDHDLGAVAPPNSPVAVSTRASRTSSTTAVTIVTPATSANGRSDPPASPGSTGKTPAAVLLDVWSSTAATTLLPLRSASHP